MELTFSVVKTKQDLVKIIEDYRFNSAEILSAYELLFNLEQYGQSKIQIKSDGINIYLMLIRSDGLMLGFHKNPSMFKAQSWEL